MTEKTSVLSKKSESKPSKTVSPKSNDLFKSSFSSQHDYIMYLQRTIGNQAVGRLLRSNMLQAKLRIGKPNDKYEKEADHVADKGINMPNPMLNRQMDSEKKEEMKTKAITEQITPFIQRQDEEKEEVQANSEINIQPISETSAKEVKKDNFIRSLARRPSYALNDWKKLNQSEKTVLVTYMDMFYGAEFSKTFLKTANSKKRPENIMHVVTNILYKNTHKKLEARGYHMAEVSYGLSKMEMWVHSNGNEVWLIHSIPSKTEKTEAKKETAKPPDKIPEVQNPDSEYGGVKGEAFNIELGAFSAGYAKLYNNGYIERFPSRHSRYVHTFVPVPGKPGEYYVYKNYKLQSADPLGLFEGPNIIEIDISKFKNTYKN
jgi:hypothetical protein